MKRMVAVLVVVGFLGGPMGPSSVEARKPKRSRTFELGYLTPYPHEPVTGVGYGWCSAGVGCTSFVPRRGERWLTVKVSDVSGGDVHAYIKQDHDGDGWSDTPDDLAPICNETKKPVPVKPLVPVVIFIMTGPWVCPISAPTSGVTEITLSNRR